MDYTHEACNDGGERANGEDGILKYGISHMRSK